MKQKWREIPSTVILFLHPQEAARISSVCKTWACLIRRQWTFWWKWLLSDFESDLSRHIGKDTKLGRDNAVEGSLACIRPEFEQTLVSNDNSLDCFLMYRLLVLLTSIHSYEMLETQKCVLCRGICFIKNTFIRRIPGSSLILHTPGESASNAHGSALRALIDHDLDIPFISKQVLVCSNKVHCMSQEYGYPQRTLKRRRAMKENSTKCNFQVFLDKCSQCSGPSMESPLHRSPTHLRPSCVSVNSVP